MTRDTRRERDQGRKSMGGKDRDAEKGKRTRSDESSESLR